MAIFDFVIFSPDLPCDEEFDIFEFECMEELEEALLSLAETAKNATGIQVLFLPPARPPFTIPDAFAQVVKALNDKLPSETIVRCVFRTAEAAGYAARHLPGNDLTPKKATMNGVDVFIILGDITQVCADAIVNASNTQLHLGSGVSGAIKRAVANPGGLQATLTRLAPIASGEVVVTHSFGLPTIGKIFHAATASGDETTIRTAAKNIFTACRTWEIRHVAMPAIGCGTGGLSSKDGAAIIYEALQSHSTMVGMDQNMFPETLSIVLYDDISAQIFAEKFGAQ